MKTGAKDMLEGPTAFERFRQAMETIVSVPKTAVLAAEKKAKRKRRKSKANQTQFLAFVVHKVFYDG